VTPTGVQNVNKTKANQIGEMTSAACQLDGPALGVLGTMAAISTAPELEKEITDTLASAKSKVGHWLRSNDYYGAIEQYEHAAALLHRTGQHKRAVEAIMQAVALLPRVENSTLQAQITLRAVSLQTSAGNLFAALDMFRSSRVTAQTTGFSQNIVDVFDELAQAFAAIHDTVRPVELWLEATAYAKQVGRKSEAFKLLKRAAKFTNRQDLWEQAARQGLPDPLLTYSAEACFLCALAVFMVKSDPADDFLVARLQTQIARYAAELSVTRQSRFQGCAASMLQAVLNLDTGMDPALAVASQTEDVARILLDGLPARRAVLAAQPAHV
jgi:tetratricopeptide (TPR) repeat protein